MFLTGSGSATKKEKGDPRTSEQRVENMLRELGNVVVVLKQLHKHEPRLGKMERWVDNPSNQDGSAKFSARVEQCRVAFDRQIELIGNLQTISIRLEQAIHDLADADRVKHIKAWGIPWPCTFQVDRYSHRLAETPWRDFCPF